jgi:16S rRNA (guanine1516-N2)-methyltransferase
MFVTTTKLPSSKITTRANHLAAELSCRDVDRGTFTLAHLMRQLQDGELWVVEENNLKFVSKDNHVLYFHPSLAKIRITSVLKGAKDRLMEVSGVVPGDSVLDCTMGLATDAIVFSSAVRKCGQVLAVESERVPYILAREGLGSYNSGIRELDDSMRRIHVIHADHLDYTRNLPSKSVDVVYFDPMFRIPDKTVALTPLRQVANPNPLRQETIVEAKRIARKSIVLKEHRDSGEFERLGFSVDPQRTSSSFAYGVIRM